MIIIISLTPSSGCRRSTSLLALGAPSAWSKIECGMGLNWMQISEARLAMRLPVRK
ncbi:hypothetical protein D3C72_2278860 [compost metagenome]